MVPQEIKDYLHGLYGKAPAPIDQEVLHKIIGNDPVITCRPADKIAPQFEGFKEKYKNLARSDEDVLSLALFEGVATKFLEAKYHLNENKDDNSVEDFNIVF